MVLCLSDEVINCNFTNNIAGARGGVLYFTGYADVTDCYFTNNNAGVYGGEIFSLSNAGDGGAVIFYENGEVTNCNFTNNNGGECGGLIIQSFGEGFIYFSYLIFFEVFNKIG